MPSWTLGSLSDLIYDRVENNRELYTQAEVTAVCNESIRIINLFTGFQENSVQLHGFTVAGQLLYQTPVAMLFPTRIAFEGRDLDKIGLRRIGQDYRNWATDTTDTYGPVARWIPIGLKTFAIHPIDATGGNNITVTGVMETRQLVNSTDVCTLDDEFVTLIVDYCGHRLVLKETGKTFADASMLIQSFWKEMKVLKRWETFKAPRYFVQVQQPK